MEPNCNKMNSPVLEYKDSSIEDYVFVDTDSVSKNDEFVVVDMDEIDKRMCAAEINHAHMEPMLTKRLLDA
jgi:hypothetical protein